MDPQPSSIGTSKVLIIVLGVLLVGVGAWYVSGIGRMRDTDTQQNGYTKQAQESGRSSTKTSAVSWSFNGTNWESTGTPPTCPDPLTLTSPVALDQATAVLYPGQMRGNQYKPHGGFRFADGTNTAVTVIAPLDASLVGGSRYIEQGEVQYLLEFVAPCGLMYRFDHLLTLSPAMQTAVSTLPEPQADDSRTSTLDPVAVTAGDPIGTAVGFVKTGNTSVDFGVYDLRSPNGAKGLPADDRQLAPYAVCWFDLLSSSDAATVRSLPPGDQENGATSSYCQ